MSRPGKKISRKTILLSNRMKELELKERSSKSLLANVLDIDDDFRHVAINSSQTAIGSRYVSEKYIIVYAHCSSIVPFNISLEQFHKISEPKGDLIK